MASALLKSAGPSAISNLNKSADIASSTSKANINVDNIDDESDEGSKSGILSKAGVPFVFVFRGVGYLLEGIFTVVSGGAFGILGLIFFVLKIIGAFLYVLFVKILPFVVWYIGIPTFILGAIMGLFFLGGHILFVIIFIAGLIFYIKNLIKVVYKLPDNTKLNQDTNTKMKK
jgi:hypothetical protein